jgi:NAD(P)-dependent dehydrogenase (short-subunit alcohol dehydrogenase family)
MGRLDGKVAIITGGASGIGKAAAQIFAREGARVVIADLQDDEGRRVADGIGADCLYVRTDVSRTADVENLVSKAVAKFGRLDIMFNNAGIVVVGPTIVDLPEADFDRMIAINLKGVWLGMKHAIPAMLKSGGGAIVNTASTSGLLGYVGQSGYGASKGGVINLTRHCAVEFAGQGIRVNCICPGATVTPMGQKNRPGMSLEEMKARNADSNPLRRTGMPEDIANAALYLASDEAAHVTGQIMAVDGGLTASSYRGPSPASGSKLES